MSWLVACGCRRVVGPGLFAAWMAVEWRTWPNGTAALGPLGLVWYNGPTVENLVVCAIAFLPIAPFLLRPGAATALPALLGAMLWLCLGSLAQGVGC